MSENITHTAVLDDCFRLMHASKEICETFQKVGAAHHDVARLGCLTRAGDRFTPELLRSFRDRWADRTSEEHLEPKLAFVLGWMCHRAADRQMKPVFRAVEPDRTYSPAKSSVYHDAFLFHEVYGGGEESPYHPALFDPERLPAAEGLDVEAVEELVRVLVQRALIALHTFIPDEEDVAGWLDRLFTLRQAYRVDLERYARAIADPDPEQVQRFIVEVDFYDPQDATIAAARGLQHGERVTPEEVHFAAEAEACSQYGKALQRGYGYLRAASAFFTGEIQMLALKDALEIGKLGRDGKGV